MPSVSSKPRPGNWQKIVDFSLEHQNEKIKVRTLAVPKQAAGTTGRISAYSGSQPASTQANTTKANLDRYLGNFVRSQGKEIADELKLDPAEKATIDTRLADILDNVSFKNSTQVTGEAVALAHSTAQHALLSLRNELSKKSTVQILPFESFENDSSGKRVSSGYRVCVIKAAPKIANLVLSGGGMKGQGYVSVVKTLENTGIRKDLQHIAGTSAGALTAACIATGMKAKDYAELVTGLNMLDQMGDADKSQPKSASSRNGHGQKGAAIRLDKGLIRFSAQKLMHTCQKTLRDNVKSFSTEHMVKLATSNLSGVEKASIRNLHKCIADETTGYQLTFADLAILHKYDPANFKELTLTGFNKTDQKLEVFNAESWPDLPIATAMRISMAIPGIIDPVILQINGQDKTMVDGGVNANLPTHLINPYATGGKLEGLASTGAQAETLHASTMALSFATDGKAQKALDRGADSIQMPWYKRIFATLMAPTKLKAFRNDTERFVEAGPNALPVHHGKLDTLSFGASAKVIRAAHVEAEVRFIDALRRNGVADQDRAMHQTYSSIDEALEHIDVEDLRASIKVPPAGDNEANKRFIEAAKKRLAAIDAAGPITHG